MGSSLKITILYRCFRRLQTGQSDVACCPSVPNNLSIVTNFQIPTNYISITNQLISDGSLCIFFLDIPSDNDTPVHGGIS